MTVASAIRGQTLANAVPDGQRPHDLVFGADIELLEHLAQQEGVATAPLVLQGLLELGVGQNALLHQQLAQLEPACCRVGVNHGGAFP